MEIVIACLLIAVILPIVSKIPLGIAMGKQREGYDNRTPRLQQQNLTGFGMRAKAAHENCFEALIMFTPGALLNLAMENINDTIIYCAIGFIIARLGYLVMYWLDLDKLRSIFWAVGFICSIALLVNPLA